MSVDLADDIRLHDHMDSENSERSVYKVNKGNRSRNKKCCGIRKMWFAAFTALLQCFALGLDKGYSAPAVYDMQHGDNSVIRPSEDEAMWIGSMLALGGVFGSLIAGPMSDRLGRKETLVYILLPHGFGWLFICYAQSIPVLLFGRFINGVACGVMSCVIPIYCVEVATVEVRGILGSSYQGFGVIGNLLSVTAGAYISWNYLALNGAVCTIIAVILFLPMPESPRWLLMKNKLPDAIKVMHNLQGGFVNAEKECTAIYHELKNQPKGGVTWEELKRPSSYKPAAICLFLMFFHQFTGIDAVLLYSSSIFEVSKEFINPKMATIILGIVQLITTLFSNSIIDKAGRKILLISSGITMGVSFAAFGSYYYKLSLDDSFKENHGWIPLVCCVTAVIGYSIGFGPIPYLLSAELVSVRVRSTLSGVTMFANGMFSFIVTKTFSSLEHMLKNYGAFWLYSSLCVFGVIYVLICVPETKGKTSEEIQAIFEKRRTNTVESINIAVIS